MSDMIEEQTNESGLVPIRGMVVVKRVDARRTASGLHLPEPSAKNPDWRAKVIAVGDGHISASGTIVPLRVRPGDFVVIVPAAGKAAIRDGEYFIVSEDMIVAIDRRPRAVAGKGDGLARTKGLPL